MLKGRKIVALCISRIHDEVSHEFVTELNKYLVECGYNLFIYSTCTDLFWNTIKDNGEKVIFDLVDYNIIDAMVIFEEKIKDTNLVANIVNNCKSKNVPVIMVGEKYDGCMSIQFDYEEGFASVVRHVLDVHQPETIHFMAGIKGNSFSNLRIEVFKKLLEERNIPFDYDTMVSYGDFWSEPTEKAMQELLNRGEKLPRAIVCANDTMAIAVCNFLQKHGYSVPDDVLVTGFDGIGEIYLVKPNVTSCICKYGDIAKKILELLIDLENGGVSQMDYLVPTHNVILRSCGCHGKPSINLSKYYNDLGNSFYLYREESFVLADMVAQFETCVDIEHAYKYIGRRKDLIYDMFCVLNKDCLDERINPLTKRNGSVFSNNMYLFYESDEDFYNNFEPRDFSVEEIAPHLERLLDRNVPLIFMALNFLDVPLGYVCFHYNNYSMGNYYKIPQTVNALNSCIGGLRNMRYQKYLTQQIEDMYKFDKLTGLYNRNGFIKEFNKLMNIISSNGGGKLTAILVDLDGLKYINDNFGHGEGDTAIYTVAQAVKYACPEDAICARFGGDEMISMFYGVIDDETIKGKLKEYLDGYNLKSHKPYSVGASIGIYVTDYDKTVNFEDLIKASDSLMYMDKVSRKAQRQ